MGVRILSLRSLAVVTFALATGVPTEMSSQELSPPVVNLQLNFADPGARSMGLGGAFVGLADDATAAFANPAGLVQLVRPEVSIEGRHTRYATPYSEGGRVEGQASHFGIDDTEGLRYAVSENRVTDISFLSLAYPTGRWSLAFFRHQLSDFAFSSETQGLFGGGTQCCQRRFLDQRTSSEFDFVNYGISGAFRVNDRLSFGLGITYLDASLMGVSDAYGVDDDTVGAIFRSNSYLPERWIVRNVAEIDDSDWTLTAGFLWNVSRRWRIGGVYRQGPEVETRTVLIAGRLIDLGVPPGETFFAGPKLTVELPTAVGLGCAYRAAGERLTVSFQWDQIRYSSVPESLDLDDQTVDDANELHLGGEYVLEYRGALVAVRTGAWWDPDHQLRSRIDDPFLSAVLPPGEDEVHYALGLGVALRRFQVDLGLDLSDRIDTVSISAIFNF